MAGPLISKYLPVGSGLIEYSYAKSVFANVKKIFFQRMFLQNHFFAVAITIIFNLK